MTRRSGSTTAKRKPKPKAAKRRTPKPTVVQLTAERVGGKLKVTATHDGRVVHLDTIDFDLAPQRDRFVKGVCKRLPGADAAVVEAELMKLPASLPALPEAEQETEGDFEPPSPTLKAILTFLPDPSGRQGEVMAEFDGATVHLDSKVEPTKAQHRKRFIKELAAKLPNLDAADADSQLLGIAETIMVEARKSRAPAGDPEELDVSHIVRPEQFHAPEVSGLAVPVVIGEGGKPAARWRLYLRWTDGRRDVQELTNWLDLPGGGKLWIHPVPGEPAVMAAPGWSAAARPAWVGGAAAPDPADLFRRLCERVAYFLYLPPDTAAGTTATVVLWLMLTYCYQAWGAVPYLYIGGPVGSGKTRLFEILARLGFRALASSNLTGPALFRTLHDRGGILLYDEAERLRQATPDQQEILSMLLAGYKRGGQAIRLEPVGDSFRPVAFDVYGPKALACVAGLPPALASRCIPLMMFRAPPDSLKPSRRIDADPAAWQALRDDLHAVALEHGPAWLGLADRADVCPRGVNGRAHELWQPILALAAWVESYGAAGLLGLVQRHALAAVETGKDDAVPEADETVLEILAEFVRRGDKPTPGEILTSAKERDPATFDKWAPQTVSRRLKAYGIAVPKKSHGERRYRDVTAETLRRVAAALLHRPGDGRDCAPPPPPGIATHRPPRHPSGVVGDCGRR